MMGTHHQPHEKRGKGLIKLFIIKHILKETYKDLTEEQLYLNPYNIGTLKLLID